MTIVRRSLGGKKIETWDTSQGREFVRGHGAFSLRQTTQKSRLKFKENGYLKGLVFSMKFRLKFSLMVQDKNS